MYFKRPGLSKRQKELARGAKLKEKAERKAMRQRDKNDRSASGLEEEDPDIAGIVPGPQPIEGAEEPVDAAKVVEVLKAVGATGLAGQGGANPEAPRPAVPAPAATPAPAAGAAKPAPASGAAKPR